MNEAPTLSAGLHNPSIFLAYAPRGVGLRCALAYLSNSRDLYGWFTGPDGATGMPGLYFILEDFYTGKGPRYVAAEGLDLHTGWTTDERRCHELAQLQDAFSREWLFEREDPRSASEIDEYARAQLALGPLNIRFSKLAKLSKLQPTWTFYSPEFEHAALQYLSKRWPLEYRPERED